jgi:hypothetical protein
MAEPTPLATLDLANIDERRTICIEALALAQRAEEAGLKEAANLLDLAALTVGQEFGLLDRRRPPGGKS